jgi:hypothetical protein
MLDDLHHPFVKVVDILSCKQRIHNSFFHSNKCIEILNLYGGEDILQITFVTARSKQFRNIVDTLSMNLLDCLDFRLSLLHQSDLPFIHLQF